MKKIGIVGATGYTGSELVRILHHHPEVEVTFITSESQVGKRFSEVHSQFRGICELELIAMADIDRYDVDVVFLALPHGVSMDFVKEHSDRAFKIIDLSGDFRLSSPSVYTEWYGTEHSFPAGFEQAIFGLPELHRDSLRSASLVANPGCYPTASILAIAPLIKEQIIKTDQLTVDAKSGVTGAGVKAKPGTHFSNVNENFTAYGVGNHRHTIEIQETLSGLAGKETNVLFTPYLLPLDRGILSTVYAKPIGNIRASEIMEIYERHYRDEPFVRFNPDQPPTLKGVRGTNYCDVFVHYNERTDTIIAMASIDNLVKGAAGQAVQNMNIILGLEETLGLSLVPLQP